MTDRLAGIFCAAATPLDRRGNPDLERLAEHARQLLIEGSDGVALLGTTGEANSFSLGERQETLEHLLAAGLPPETLMPGTGLCAVPETVALTRHALSYGVNRVVMLPPYYYKQPTDDGLFAAFSRVIDGVADSKLRIILYHFPQMSAVPLGHALIARLLAAYPEIIAGIKDSSGDLANMQTMAREFPGFAVFAGSDPLMLPLLKAGGAGCITATANLIAGDLATVFHSHRTGEDRTEAGQAQQRITQVRSIIGAFPQIPAIKALIARRYADPGWRRVRPPLVELSETQRDDLFARIDGVSV